MAEQLSFLDEAQPTDRLFYALFPPAEIATRIAAQAQALCGELGLTGKPLKPERLHITLAHLGDYAGVPQNIVAKAREAAGDVAMAPFDIAFDRAESFAGRPDNRPFVLRGDDGVAGVEVFQRSLGVAMAKAGLGRWARPYAPHVTLLYDHRIITAQAIEPIGWTARDFVLVHSLLGQTKHIPLARWPLGV